MTDWKKGLVGCILFWRSDICRGNFLLTSASCKKILLCVSLSSLRPLFPSPLRFWSIRLERGPPFFPGFRNPRLAAKSRPVSLTFGARRCPEAEMCVLLAPFWGPGGARSQKCVPICVHFGGPRGPGGSFARPYYHFWASFRPVVDQ